MFIVIFQTLNYDSIGHGVIQPKKQSRLGGTK
jgi:hypothetical protein